MPTPTSQALILTEAKETERSLSATLASCGFEAFTAAKIEIARTFLETGRAELILVDLDVTIKDPLEFIAGARRSNRSVPVLVLFSEESIQRGIEAVNAGFPWYLKKPVRLPEMRLALAQIQRFAGAFDQVQSEQLAGETDDGAVYGSRPEIQSILKVVAQVAPRGEHLTIIGEPGSGKRLIGRLIHRSSRRSSAAYMHCSCAGLSESVVEGELFGRADGHAGGDGSRQVGCLEVCDHGTLLIDEIGALPRRTQEKLLKCMTRRSFHLPGRGTRSADVRIIATSSLELEERVQEGRFHRELFDRLQGIRIHVPPLRQRQSDIPILVDHFVREAARRASQPLNGVDPSALARLMQYDWPGNVRELRDIVGHAVSRAAGPLLRADDLPSLPEPVGSGSNTFAAGATIQEIEKEAILRTLEGAGGSTSRAAKILDMSVRKIQYKLKEYRREAATAIRLETVRSIPPRMTKTEPKKKTVFVAQSDPGN